MRKIASQSCFIFASIILLASPMATGKAKANGVESNKRKLRDIIVQSIDIKNADVDDLRKILEKVARDNDPEAIPSQKGVSVVIRFPELAKGKDKPLEDNTVRIKRLSLKNVPLDEVLRQVCIQLKPKMKVEVEEYVVAIVPAADNGEAEMFNRIIAIPNDFIKRLDGKKQAKADLFKGGGDDKDKALRKQLRRLGVTFPERSSLRFIRATTSIAVTNTQTELDKIEKIIKKAAAGNLK